MKHVSTVLVLIALTLAGCGGGGSGDTGSESPGQGPVTPDGISVLAGVAVGGGSIFNRPFGVAVDGAGTIYVADTENHAIRKISTNGIVTTLAGKPGTWGSADGVGMAARFLEPRGVAVDGGGNVYVADTANFTVRRIAPDGTVTTLAGTAGTAGSVNGVGTAAQFGYPWGIAVDATGNVVVSGDSDNTIRRISPAGVVTTIAGRPGVVGWTNGPGSVATFYGPAGVAVDAAGRIYVAGRLDDMVRTITPAGVVSTLAGIPNTSGERDGPAATALFDYPTGIAVNATGTVYVADSADGSPSNTTSTVRRITSSGEVTTLAGTAGVLGSSDGVGATASFNFLQGLAVDPVGNVYAADTFNNTVRRITAAGVVTTVAGTAPITDTTCVTSDGVGADAKFCHPQALATDRNGNVYVADTISNTIRKITPAGVVSTLAGHAGVSGTQDGAGTAATFDGPSGIAVDKTGTVYVADANTHLIRKISAAGVVTTLAGADWQGSSGGFAIFYPSRPTAIAVDGAGTVYVVDGGAQKVRKIAPTGEVSAAPGLDYAFNVSGIAVDAAGNLYLSDGATVSIVAPNGTRTTLAGSDHYNSFDGVGPQAGFAGVADLALDGAGGVYVVDQGNNTIRHVARDGTVTTIVGQGGSSGIVLGPLPGAVDRPYGLAIDGNGVLYTASEGAVLRIKLSSPSP